MLGTQFLTRSVREVIDFLMSVFQKFVDLMIDFRMSILSTPFCVHADKTSNFVDLFSEME